MSKRGERKKNRRRFFSQAVGGALAVTGARPNWGSTRLSAASALGPRTSGEKELAEDLQTIDSYSKKIKAQIYKRPSGILRYPYLTAGVKAFPYLVDWDAVWGGMSYLIDGDPDPLRNSLLNFLDHIVPDGKGQRVIKPKLYGAPVFQNRPFLATGVFILSRELNSTKWLPAWAWERLRSYLLYWHTHRTGRQGLLKWWQVDEGFGDNGLGNWAWDVNSVEAVDLNAQMTLEHSAAAWVATHLGRVNEAQEHRMYAEALQVRLQQALWDEKDGFYYSSYNPPERGQLPYPIRCLHYTNLWPLWLGLAREDQARRIIETYILNPEHFWSGYGVRSMAKSEPRYNNAIYGVTLPMIAPHGSGPAGSSSNWQGPIWSITNYLVATALARYGYKDEARIAARRVIRVHAQSVRETGVFHENYDAETGQPLAHPGGIASWCLMLRFLPRHLGARVPWILKGLDLPAPG